MKSYVLTETDNVKRARTTIAYLLSRPKSEMVGLGLIWGKPGLGKTRFAKRIATNEGYIWLRLEATSTARSFVGHLYNALLYKGNQLNEPVRGRTNDIYQKCLELLEDMPNTVIILDEIDYAFRDKALLGTIRDIVDQTTAAIVMVGMGDAKTQLLKANTHYFDRCNSFCEFLPIGLDDCRKVITEVSDITIQDDLKKHIHGKTRGNLRLTMKMINIVEAIAKVKKLTSIGLQDTGEINVE